MSGAHILNENPIEENAGHSDASHQLSIAVELPIVELKEKLSNPFYLPTVAEIDSLQSRSSKDFKEVFAGLHEIPTQESIGIWANYLIKQLDEGFYTRPVVILDAGAGKGALAYFLQDKLDSRMPEVFTIVAVDSSDSIESPYGNVSHLSVDEALRDYHPQVVLCSWMSPTADLSASFRQANVKEYLLIGQKGNPEGSVQQNTGLREDTWGYKDDADGIWDSSFVPLYERDGYKRTDLDEFAHYQRSYYHNGVSIPLAFRSTTVSFKKSQF